MDGWEWIDRWKDNGWMDGNGLALTELLRLGVRLQLLGSVLVLSCSNGQFWALPAAGGWKDKLSHQLDLATADLCAWKSATHSSCSFKRIKLSALHVLAKLDWPWLKCKAANAACLTDWLLYKYDSFGPLDDVDSLIRLCLGGFSQVYSVIKHKHRWLTEADAATLESGREAALYGFNALSSLFACQDPPCPLFKMTPKFHQMDHILRVAVRDKLNPRVFWTLGDESFGGEVALVCRGLHPSSMSVRCVQRWMAFFFQEARDF